ncbi:phage tail protein [Pseudomonas sp. CVAP|uniref:phage tail protein n=1 Tax=Pseudomonas sp. CVAP\|nr:phage tail protein [Pseudomonas sp. CVAP\
MIDANSQFFAILTNVGMAKQANADALGIPWKITEMGVGDANPGGVENPPNPVPSPTQPKLLNEWRRKPLNQLKIDPVNPAVIIAEQIIPADEGGKWIREIGLYDADGDLVAVANCAPSFKPLLSQGSGRTQIVRMNFIVSSTGNITLKIDPAIVLASRAYVEAAILEVLPKNKTPGEFTRIKVSDRGLVVSGDNPDTLAGMGIKDGYTKAEVESMIAQASALPVGTMVAYPVNKVPPGFLEIDGSIKSIAVYPDLATFLGAAFNKGDEGAGNFRLPESRGEYLRGWDHGRGIDAGRGIGTYQGASYLYDTLGQLSTPNRLASSVQDEDLAGRITRDLTVCQPSVTTNTASYVDTGRAVRTRNLSVMWCIKAWNAPINQGNIDVAALVTLAAQATETNQGTVKVATQAQVNEGLDDTTIVTPKKLRRGFAISLATNGYIAFPTWLGGWIIQWGTVFAPTYGTANVHMATPIAWPMAFPNAVRGVGGSIITGIAANSFTNWSVEGRSQAGASWYYACGQSGLNPVLSYIAIGN